MPSTEDNGKELKDAAVVADKEQPPSPSTSAADEKQQQQQASPPRPATTIAPSRPLPRHPRAATSPAVSLSQRQLIAPHAIPQNDASTVHLYNVPSQVTDGYLLDLCSRWGSVASIARQVSKLAQGGLEIVIVYQKPGEAQEALRHLDGGSLFGSALHAQLRTTVLAKHLESFNSRPLSEQEALTQASGGPRNLYVLNLSLEMTNQELERLFSVFGQVTHVCIMAVLDNLGRRRAFVDMGSGEAARQAIASLSGTTIHGYKIDVSFAIIQRSGGPVTDYPPTLRKRAQQASLHLSRNPHASASAYVRTQHQLQLAGISPPQIMPPLPAATSAAHPSGMVGAHPPLPHPAVGTAVGEGALIPYGSPPMQAIYGSPGQTMMLPSPYMGYEDGQGPLRQIELYVSNLDPVAVVDDEDLANLFKPFGTVMSAQLALDPNGLSLGVGVVRMGNPMEAESARTHVQGRVMDSKRVSVTFSPPMGSQVFMNGNNGMTSPSYASPGGMTSSSGQGSTPMLPTPGMTVPSPSFGQESGAYYHPSSMYQQMAALTGSMSGLGIYDHSPQPISSSVFGPASVSAPHLPSAHQPAPLLQRQQPPQHSAYSQPVQVQGAYYYSPSFVRPQRQYNPQNYRSQGYERENTHTARALNQSTATNATSASSVPSHPSGSHMHMREASVETSATTASRHTGSSLEIRIEDDLSDSTTHDKDQRAGLAATDRDSGHGHGGIMASSVSSPKSRSISLDVRVEGFGSASPTPFVSGGESQERTPRTRSVTTEGLVRTPGNSKSKHAGGHKTGLLRSVTEHDVEDTTHDDGLELAREQQEGEQISSSRGMARRHSARCIS